MPGPVRNVETFSQGAGFDLGGSWITANDGGSGSVDPDYPAQSWMRSIYVNHLRVINAAGNTSTTGQAFAALTLPTTQDTDSMVFGYGVETHSLGVSQEVGAFILLNAALTVILLNGRLVTDASSNLFLQTYGWGNGSQVELVSISPLPYGLLVPLRIRIDVSINGPNFYKVSIDDGLLSQQQSVTDVPRQTTRLGAVLFGNTNRAVTVQPATQVYSYLQIGDVAPAARLSRLRSSVVPALAALSFMGHLFRRIGDGLWIPTVRLPEFPAPGVA